MTRTVDSLQTEIRFMRKCISKAQDALYAENPDVEAALTALEDSEGYIPFDEI